MSRECTRPRRALPLLSSSIAGLLVASVAAGTIVFLSFEDLHLRGTQVGQANAGAILSATNCQACHGYTNPATEPYATWSGSLMGQAGRDPLFFAQMALANQDTVNAGYFCMRCHVPMTFVTGHAMQPDGSTLSGLDKEGVSCHFCHSMVDPVYKPGVSPSGDQAILAGLEGGPPEHYGNSMFVLDPAGNRRSARLNPQTPHEFVASPFHATGNFCGTCHEVGNVAVSRQADGTYRYNALDQRTPDENPEHLFPLERTFSEWRLSAFASGGVDMGGRFGGVGAGVVSTCQDCHMPRASGKLCIIGPARGDARTHDFAGAGAQVLDIIAAYTQGDPAVNPSHIAAGRAKAVDMLQRAASLSLSQSGATLTARVTNESGHKLPTGHIEGRRVWLNVVFRDGSGTVVGEHGAYDAATAELDTSSTRVYEMRVGLSADAAQATGLPAGVTAHMALADTIEFDNRIPPRGFVNAAFEAAGAPAVGHAYADGQYWDDAPYAIPPGAESATVRLYYQNTPKEYIEHLRDANTSNHWGNTLYNLWSSTGKGAPILMAQATLALTPPPLPCPGDFDHDGGVTVGDLFGFLDAWFAEFMTCGSACAADIDHDGEVWVTDLFLFLDRWFAGYGQSCP